MLSRTLSVVIVALIGCGGGAAADQADASAGDAATGHLDSGAGDASGDSAPAPAKMTLRVTEAAQLQFVTFPTPALGNRLVEVTLSLANTGETKPLPVDPSAFSLEADSLLYAESPSSSRAAVPCPASVAIENGGTLSCQAIFEVPWSSSVNRLIYDDTMGRSAAAVIDTVAPPDVLCTGWPVSTNCSSCVQNLASFCHTETKNMNEACARETATQCVTTTKCPEVANGCAPSTACAIALDAYQACVYESCSGNCP
jgi:hypothetical protein